MQWSSSNVTARFIITTTNDLRRDAVQWSTSDTSASLTTRRKELERTLCSDHRRISLPTAQSRSWTGENAEHWSPPEDINASRILTRRLREGRWALITERCQCQQHHYEHGIECALALHEGWWAKSEHREGSTSAPLEDYDLKAPQQEEDEGSLQVWFGRRVARKLSRHHDRRDGWHRTFHD